MIELFGYKISLKQFPYRLIGNSPIMVNTINAYSYQVAKTDEDFKLALQSSDILIPDGIGFKIAAKVLAKTKIDKYSGYDLHNDVLNNLNKNNGSCFYFGSSQKTLELIAKRINKEYPNIKVGLLSPPFKSIFTDEDNAGFIEIINDFKPDVLFVGLTAPKQEKWSYASRDKLNAKYICTIGAVFDFYAGTVKKPNPILVKLGLEWLSRLFNDPKHMIKRYKKLPITSFLIEILKHKLKKA